MSNFPLSLDQSADYDTVADRQESGARTMAQPSAQADDYTREQIQQAYQMAAAANDQPAMVELRARLGSTATEPQAVPRAALSSQDDMAPVAADPDYSPQEILQAYHMAAQHQDQPAMQHLDGMLRAAYTRQNASNPVDGMSTGQRLLAGLGHGMKREAQGGLNLLHIRSDALGSTDQDLSASDAEAAPLLNTPAGKIGDMAGQVVDTLPLGGVDGAIAKGGERLLAAGATKAAPWVARVLKLANAARRPALAAGEGALQSAATATPDDQGGQAGQGAELGAGLGVLGGVGGRVVRGLVDKSPAAQRLYDAAAQAGKDLFIPVSQGAADSGLSGAARTAYRSVFPYALGVEGRLVKQSNAAKAALREVVAQEGTPIASDAEGATARLATPTGETPQQTAANLSSLYDQQYAKIKGHIFTKPSDFQAQVLGRVSADLGDDVDDVTRNKVANLADAALERFSSGKGQISGNNLLNARNWISNAVPRGEVAPGTVEERALSSGTAALDDMIDAKLAEYTERARTAATTEERAQFGAAARDLQDYKNLAATYREFKPFQEAVQASRPARGVFSFRTLARNARPGSRVESIGQDATEVLENAPASRNFFHTLGGVGLPAELALHSHPGIAAAAWAVPNVLALRSVQRGLYGDTAVQKALAAAIRRNPQIAYSAGLAGRAAVDANGQ